MLDRVAGSRSAGRADGAAVSKWSNRAGLGSKKSFCRPAPPLGVKTFILHLDADVGLRTAGSAPELITKCCGSERPPLSAEAGRPTLRACRIKTTSPIPKPTQISAGFGACLLNACVFVSPAVASLLTAPVVADTEGMRHRAGLWATSRLRQLRTFGWDRWRAALRRWTTRMGGNSATVARSPRPSAPSPITDKAGRSERSVQLPVMAQGFRSAFAGSLPVTCRSLTGGFASGVTEIGGGVFLAPLLILFGQMPAKKIVGISPSLRDQASGPTFWREGVIYNLPPVLASVSRENNQCAPRGPWLHVHSRWPPRRQNALMTFVTWSRSGAVTQKATQR